jgi:hypothetical protein
LVSIVFGLCRRIIKFHDFRMCQDDDVHPARVAEFSQRLREVGSLGHGLQVSLTVSSGREFDRRHIMTVTD